MRVAALYDIHANLPALEAVIQDIRRVDVNHIVIGGDVFPGPMPRETLRCLLDLDIPVRFIQGNGDRVVLAHMIGKDINEVPEQFRDVIRWTAQHLDQGHEQLLASWPSTLSVEVDELDKVLFCHATPQNDTDVFTRLTSEDRLLPVFEGVDVSLVVCGHTHMQFDRTIGELRVVNAGSVGMPFAQPQGAYWLLLGPDVELRHTPYDFAKAAERIRATGFPQAEDLAVRYVLRPPSESESLELFRRVELK